MTKRVVVTGLGCISPVGNNVPDTWSALLAGKSGAGPITRFDASKHKTKFAAEVKGFDPVSLLGARDARKFDRYAQLAIAAAQEALDQSGFVIDEFEPRPRGSFGRYGHWRHRYFHGKR